MPFKPVGASHGQRWASQDNFEHGWLPRNTEAHPTLVEIISTLVARVKPVEPARATMEPPTMNSTLVSLFEYKAWANTELHAVLSNFDAKRHPGEFRAMLRTLDHANVVDRIFQGHLTGAATPLFKATHSEPTPSLPELREIVKSTDDWYLHFVRGVTAEQLKHRVNFKFTDGDGGAMSFEEMLLHVITHSGYHRGSIGQMLEDIGTDSPPDSLTKFLHWREPQRRLGAERQRGG